jgi:hypothetical protein
MFGKWLVLEGMPSPLKSQITRSILRSYPGSMLHIKQAPSDLKAILKLKETIQDHLCKNTSVICSSWISTTLNRQSMSLQEMNLLDTVLRYSRPDLSVALLFADSDFERNLKLSEHIDLFLSIKKRDENSISRLVLDHLLRND